MNGDHSLAANLRHRRQYSSPSSSSMAALKGCCCCLFLLLTFVFLLFLAIFLFILLVVKPKRPQFDLQQVYVGVAAPNPSAMDSATSMPSLSFAIHMLFNSVNPNKVGIRYGESRFTVMYHGVPLGRAAVPGFYQDSSSERRVEAVVAIDQYGLLQSYGADLLKHASLNDRVEFQVIGVIRAKIRVLSLYSPPLRVSSWFYHSVFVLLNYLLPKHPSTCRCIYSCCTYPPLMHSTHLVTYHCFVQLR